MDRTGVTKQFGNVLAEVIGVLDPFTREKQCQILASVCAMTGDYDDARRFLDLAESAKEYPSLSSEQVEAAIAYKLPRERMADAKDVDRALDAAIQVAREHLVWAMDPGRLTPDELRLVAGACNAIAAGISALRTQHTPHPLPEEKP